MNHHAFTWTPGHPEQTFLLETTHLAGLLARLPCDVSYLPAP
jgi:Ala-tRNA(Pro) deacylase